MGSSSIKKGVTCHKSNLSYDNLDVQEGGTVPIMERDYIG